MDAFLAERIGELIEEHPTFGYRRLWALLRYGDGLEHVEELDVERALDLLRSELTPFLRERGVSLDY